jgi:hypothetical protein
MKIAIINLPRKKQRLKENNVFVSCRLWHANNYFDLAPEKIILG